MALTILKVSQLNKYVKSQLDADSRLREVYLSGEISTLTVNRTSGHMYFSLKDETASIRCVIFSRNLMALRFMPQVGMPVIARGAASLYERDGTFQLVATEILPDDNSATGYAFEQLKKMFAEKGYFDPSKKQQIPANPSVIGVVTSSSGAALQDILRVIKDRNPSVHVLVSPATVQGADAANSIAKAITLLEKDGRAQVILVCRGGGSAEDLWAFNEEPVVKTVFQCSIPTISGVGHETDITLCDFAADVRAATPTGAATMAVSESREGLEKLFRAQQQLDNLINYRLNLNFQRLEVYKNKISSENAVNLLNKNRQTLNNLIEFMYKNQQLLLKNKKREVLSTATLLDGLSPLKVLARGYSVVEKGEKIISHYNQLTVGDTVNIKFHQGAATATINQIKNQ